MYNNIILETDLTSPDKIGYVLLAVGALILIIGLFKKVLMICVIAVLIMLASFVAQPSTTAQIKDFLVNTVSSAIDPLKDDDYKDVEREANGEEVDTQQDSQ